MSNDYLLLEEKNPLISIPIGKNINNSSIEMENTALQTRENLDETKRLIKELQGISLHRGIFKGHTGKVKAIACYIDSRTIASGGEDQVVKIWSLKSRQVLYNLQEHTKAVNTLDYSDDGKWLVSGGEDNEIFVWDAKNYKLQAKLQGHTNQVTEVSFSKDNKQILTCSLDQTVKVWDVSTFKLEYSFHGHEKGILTACFSPDQKYIATGSIDSSIIIWNVENNSAKNILLIKYHADEVTSVKFSADGSKLISSSKDKLIKVSSTHFEQFSEDAAKTLTSHKKEINKIYVSYKEQRMASCGSDKLVVIYDTDSLCEEARYRGVLTNKHPDGPDGPILDVVITRDDKRILTTNNNDIKIWNVESYNSEKTLEAHEKQVRQICYLHTGTNLTDYNNFDGPFILSCGDDHLIKIFDCEEYIEVTFIHGLDFKQYQQKHGHTDQVRQICVKPEKPQKHHDNKVKNKNPNQKNTNEYIINKQFASCGNDKRVLIWDANTFQILKDIVEQQQNEKDFFIALAYSPNGQFLAAGGTDGIIRIWETDNYILNFNIQAHEELIFFLAFDYNSEQLASASKDNHIKIWSTNDFSETAVLMSHQDDVICVAFDPKKGRLASCSADRTIKIWNTFSYKVEATLKGHMGSVYQVNFSPDGQRLVSCGKDNLIKIWSSESYQEEKTLTGHKEAVRSVLFSPDGEKILSCSMDKTIRIWPSMDDIDFEYHNTFIKNIKEADNKQIKDFNLPAFISKFKNSEGSYNYPRIRYDLTPIHVLCYDKDLDNLNRLLKILTKHNIYIPPFKDVFGKTPFDIAKENKFMLTILLNYYSNKQLKRRISDSLQKSFSDALPNLIQKKINGLSRFVDQQLEVAKVLDNQNEDISQNIISAELEDDFKTITFYNYYLYDEKDYSDLIIKFQEGQGQVSSKVEIKCLNLPYITRNREFLIQLTELNNDHPLFENDAIEFVLQYKWNHYGKKEFFKDTMESLFLFLLFSFNALFIMPEKIKQHNLLNSNLTNWETFQFQYMPFIMEGAILLTNIFKAKKELNQIIVCKKVGVSYIQNFWNQMDLVCILLIFISTVFDLLHSLYPQSQEQYIDWLQASVSITQLILGFRFLAYCRGVKIMSFLIRLLSQIFIQIEGFMMIFLFLILVFSASSFIIQNPSYSISRWEVVRIYHRLIIGDADDKLKGLTAWNENQQNLVWLYYFSATFLLVIIMLNLLIALIGDSYNKVYSLTRQNENYEKAHLLLEIDIGMEESDLEKLMKKFLFISQCKQDHEENEDVQDKIKNTVEEISKTLKKTQTNLNEQGIKHKNQFKEIKATLTEQGIKHKNQYKEIQAEVKQIKSDIAAIKQLLEQKLQ